MYKEFYYLIGTVFIVASGLIYTIERLISYISWTGQMVTASYPTYPKLPGLLTNMIVPIFLILSVISFIVGYKKNN